MCLSKRYSIYTLSDKDGNVFYVGATIQYIEHRFSIHISQAKRCQKGLAKPNRKDNKIISLNFDVFCNVVKSGLLPQNLSVNGLKYYILPIEYKYIKKYMNKGCILYNRENYENLLHQPTSPNHDTDNTPKQNLPINP